MIPTLWCPVCCGDDPDDDAVLACALAAEADLIVSGDGHLRNLKHYHRIQIVSPAEAIRLVGKN